MLTPEIVADDEQIAIVTDHILHHAPELRRRSRKIIRAQRALQEAIDRPAWDLYLQLESVVNERFEKACILIARVAFAAGRSRRR